MKTRNILFVFFSTITMISIGAVVSAGGIEYKLLSPVAGAQPVVSTFGEYMKYVIPFVIQLAAVLAVIQIVIGGFEYAVSEAVTNKQEAKDRITQAVIGLLLGLTSYLILNTINPKLVELQIPIPKITCVIHLGAGATTPADCPPGYSI